MTEPVAYDYDVVSAIPLNMSLTSPVSYFDYPNLPWRLKSGEDAKHYQERQAKQAIESVKQ